LRWTPAEFWSATPLELDLALQGYEAELLDQRKLLAWHAAIVIAPHTKRKVTPAQLLGERETAGPMPGIFLDKESLVDAIKEQRRLRAEKAAENDDDE
jgi:hypothetical protein